MNVVVDGAGAEPPFEQIRRQIAEGAADGSLAAGQKLPTVRRLAADLGLAVNTVARAYRELESDGVTESYGRRGTFIASQKLGDADAHQSAAGFVATARRQGLSLDETIRLIEKHWQR